MKKIKILLIASLLTSNVLPLIAQKTLKSIITVQLPEGDGANAASIIWHPTTKKYYTTIIGNSIYAMGIYDAKGKPVEQNIEAEFDYRGFWYNPVSKRIEFNCYDSAGIGHLVLDTKGKIEKKEIDFAGMNQPTSQAVGTYYPTGNSIIYLDEADYTVEKYSAKTGNYSSILTKLYVGCKSKSEADEMDSDTETSRWEGRNKSTVVYTGMAKAELAILNYDDRIVEFYDQKTGLLSKTFLKIPDSITIHLNFNFCYNNGMWWFFNKDERKWVGCK